MTVNLNVTHPPSGRLVNISLTSVENALLHFDGKREPVGVLKHLTTSLHLAWIESQNESENIQTMPEFARVEYLDAWTTYIDVGTRAIKDLMQFSEQITVTDKRSARLAKLGISVSRLGWLEVSAKEVTLRKSIINPSEGKLEDIPPFKNYGKDDVRTYDIFRHPLFSHAESRTVYQPRHKHIGTDPSLSYLTDSVGYRDGKMENVLQALKQHRTYRDSENKRDFRSHVLNAEDPTQLISKLKEFINEKVENPFLKEMELDALADIGPFDRYPIEYFRHKAAVSYDAKDTSFDFTTFSNAWSCVARIVVDAIAASNADVNRRMPGYKNLLFGPDPTQMSMERKRSTSNAGFPTFGKDLSEEEWIGFAKEVDAVMRKPEDFDPTHYPMIVGCRIVGKDLKIPDGLSSADEFEYIKKKNKQRVIQMGSSLEFILGTKFTHPLFRVISNYTKEFSGLKSWNTVKSPLATFFGRHKAGSDDPLAIAFGADASGFDASVGIFEWIMVKRLFQLIYPGFENVLEFYFTMAAFSPTITLGKDRQPIVIEGCSGVASGVACTAIVDSLVQLARGVAVLMELGMIPNEHGARIPKGIATFVCGDDLGIVVAKSCDNGKLTAEAFCSLYKKYGGEAHPEKQLITTPSHPLGVTLLFLKRLFSENRKSVGWGTRLLSHAFTGLIFSNPNDMTASAKVSAEFIKSGRAKGEDTSEIYKLVAMSDDAKLFFEGDLSLERRDYNHNLKKAAEANAKIRRLFREYDAGEVANFDHLKDLDVRWPYKVTHEDSLDRMVALGILTEAQRLQQIEDGAKLKLYDGAKMHLIKAVQQIEECHPHPLFKEWAEWVLNMNPNYFNYNILLGDDCREIATYLRASVKGEGLGKWKIMDIIRTHWVALGNVDTTNYLTRAFVDKIVDSGDAMVKYLSTLSECPSAPFDTSMKTVRTLLDRLYTHIGYMHQTHCSNAAADVTLVRNNLLAIRVQLKYAVETGDRSQLSVVADDVEYYADLLSGAYSAMKHMAITRDSVMTASPVGEPNDKT